MSLSDDEYEYDIEDDTEGDTEGDIMALETFKSPSTSIMDSIEIEYNKFSVFFLENGFICEFNKAEMNFIITYDSFTVRFFVPDKINYEKTKGSNPIIVDNIIFLMMIIYENNDYDKFFKSLYEQVCVAFLQPKDSMLRLSMGAGTDETEIKKPQLNIFQETIVSKLTKIWENPKIKQIYEIFNFVRKEDKCPICFMNKLNYTCESDICKFHYLQRYHTHFNNIFNKNPTVNRLIISLFLKSFNSSFKTDFYRPLPVFVDSIDDLMEIVKLIDSNNYEDKDVLESLNDDYCKMNKLAVIKHMNYIKYFLMWGLINIDTPLLLSDYKDPNKDSSQKTTVYDVMPSLSRREYLFQSKLLESKSKSKSKEETIKIYHGSVETALFSKSYSKYKDETIMIYHGSNETTWYSILRHGLINLSKTKYMTAGAAYGEGIYTSPSFNLSLGYAKGTKKIVAICEVIKGACEEKTKDIYTIKDDINIRIRKLHVIE